MFGWTIYGNVLMKQNFFISLGDEDYQIKWINGSGFDPLDIFPGSRDGDFGKDDDAQDADETIISDNEEFKYVRYCNFS